MILVMVCAGKKATDFVIPALVTPLVLNSRGVMLFWKRLISNVWTDHFSVQTDKVKEVNSVSKPNSQKTFLLEIVEQPKSCSLTQEVQPNAS